MTLEEIIAAFEPAKINRKAAQFDLDKCNWLNWQYLVALSLDEFIEAALPYIDRARIPYGSRDALRQVLALIKEKIKQLPETPNWLPYFFNDDFPIEPDAAEKLNKPGARDLLTALSERYAALDEWNAASLEAALKELAAARGVKAGELVHPARAAVSGRTIGPSLYHMLEVLGKDRVIARINRALKPPSPATG
jgi:glutamyl-tRNA synthetase